MRTSNLSASQSYYPQICIPAFLRFCGCRIFSLHIPVQSPITLILLLGSQRPAWFFFRLPPSQIAIWLSCLYFPSICLIRYFPSLPDSRPHTRRNVSVQG
ncbi:hypothetical protein BDR05DRAFT_278825 [Suillus weaverae]|nr:hypothetical protein BDR05DRAFT_278825 [Suillus weaverae]